MRRAEFDVKDENSLNEVLETCKYGSLSLISEGKPYVVALNFVFFENSIFFHGAKEGKKIEAIKSNPNASPQGCRHRQCGFVCPLCLQCVGKLHPLGTTPQSQ